MEQQWLIDTHKSAAGGRSADCQRSTVHSETSGAAQACPVSAAARAYFPQHCLARRCQRYGRGQPITPHCPPNEPPDIISHAAKTLVRYRPACILTHGMLSRSGSRLRRRGSLQRGRMRRRTLSRRSLALIHKTTARSDKSPLKARCKVTRSSHYYQLR